MATVRLNCRRPVWFEWSWVRIGLKQSGPWAALETFYILDAKGGSSSKMNGIKDVLPDFTYFISSFGHIPCAQAKLGERNAALFCPSFLTLFGPIERPVQFHSQTGHSVFLWVVSRVARKPSANIKSSFPRLQKFLRGQMSLSWLKLTFSIVSNH